MEREIPILELQLGLRSSKMEQKLSRMNDPRFRSIQPRQEFLPRLSELRPDYEGFRQEFAVEAPNRSSRPANPHASTFNCY